MDSEGGNSTPDTLLTMWSSDFRRSLSKKHIQKYLRVLLGCYSDFFSFSSHTPPPWPVYVLDLSGIGRLPGGMAVALEFCRSHPLHDFSSAIGKWVLEQSKLSSFGTDPEIEQGLYAWVLQETQGTRWKENPTFLAALAQIQPPREMTPDKRKSAADTWKSRLKGRPSDYTTTLLIQNQIYLLSDDREERFRVLRNCLPVIGSDFSPASVSLWSGRINDHCRQYPDDEERLRNHCLDSIRQGGFRSWECLGGWFGISLLGAGEAEPYLMELIRSGLNHRTPLPGNEWKPLSRWQPVSTTVRSQLLDWWYSLDVAPWSPIFRPRWEAIFSLEDESRLVELIVQRPHQAASPIIPDGWRPRCPQLQARLADDVIGRMDTWLSTSSGRSHPPCHDDLWGLLFSLSVPGPIIIRHIQSALTLPEKIPDTTLARIGRLLQSPGLPNDTLPEDIRQGVTVIVDSFKSQSWQTASLEKKRYTSLLVTNLLQEYIRLGQFPPAATDRGGADGVAADGTGNASFVPVPVDTDWLNTTLESVTCVKTTGLRDIFYEIATHLTTVKPGHHLPSSSVAMVRHLWVTGINHLATCLENSLPESPGSTYIGSLLAGISCLSRHIRPDAFAIHADADRSFAGDGMGSGARPSTAGMPAPSRLPEAPYSREIPRLLETLSRLVLTDKLNVRSNWDKANFLLAGAVGNFLSRHVGAAQRQQWWCALGSISPSVAENFANLSDIVCESFLFENLFPDLEKTLRQYPAGHLPDTTATLRFLRYYVHTFPDHATPARQFWAETWKDTFETWKMEHPTMDAGGKSLAGGSRMHPPRFVNRALLEQPVPAHLSGNTGFLPQPNRNETISSGGGRRGNVTMGGLWP